MTQARWKLTDLVKDHDILWGDFLAYANICAKYLTNPFQCNAYTYGTRIMRTPSTDWKRAPLSNTGERYVFIIKYAGIIRSVLDYLYLHVRVECCTVLRSYQQHTLKTCKHVPSGIYLFMHMKRIWFGNVFAPRTLKCCYVIIWPPTRKGHTIF